MGAVSQQESLWPDLQRSTGKGSIDHLERYYTPDKLARFCLSLLPWEGIESVLEPHGGGGAFVRRFECLKIGAKLHVMDVDATCWAHKKWKGQAVLGDFLTHPALPRVDRVIGNPPFSSAEQHVERGLEVASEVCFLLPVSRFDAQERVPFYRDIPLRKVWKLGERVWPGSRQIAFFWFDVTWPHTWHQTEIVLWDGPITEVA